MAFMTQSLDYIFLSMNIELYKRISKFIKGGKYKISTLDWYDGEVSAIVNFNEIDSYYLLHLCYFDPNGLIKIYFLMNIKKEILEDYDLKQRFGEPIKNYEDIDVIMERIIEANEEDKLLAFSVVSSLSQVGEMFIIPRDNLKSISLDVNSIVESSLDKLYLDNLLTERRPIIVAN